MVSQLIVLPCLVSQLHFCVHLYIYLGTTVTLTLPFAQKPFWIAIGYMLLMLWREKGHPRYKSSFQNNKVITIHLDTAQLSTDSYSNFIVLTYYGHLAYLL